MPTTPEQDAALSTARVAYALGLLASALHGTDLEAHMADPERGVLYLDVNDRPYVLTLAELP